VEIIEGRRFGRKRDNEGSYRREGGRKENRAVLTERETLDEVSLNWLGAGGKETRYVPPLEKEEGKESYGVRCSLL